MDRSQISTAKPLDSYNRKVKYSGHYRITEELSQNIENADELLARKVIINLVESIPLETIKKFFNYKVLDPNSESAKEIMADLKADSGLKQKILRMREERILEVSAHIEI